MKKGAMQTQGRLMLRSPRLWDEPSLQATIDELAMAGAGAAIVETRLAELSQQTGFPVDDLRELLAVAACWREGHALHQPALAA